ncbi:MAG: hypothetical protein KJP17_02695 [Gammaproteobacteria bacterium]|nr:hypothetical protein [Gammaproteobacteria bacterium]
MSSRGVMADPADNNVQGEFIDMDGDRYYAIRNVHKMAPFFVSVVSADDHWLFVSSTGGVTAGRVSPETALFPYETVDRLHLTGNDAGPKTIVRINDAGGQRVWEPFNSEHRKRFAIRRNLYKNALGNKLCFEEINDDLGLAFRYTWATSEEFGFVRDCELRNVGDNTAEFDVLDGLQNVLPAGTPRFTQTNSSNLVNAYKWAEIDESTGLAFLSLYSGITDRAEPCESLQATTVYCLGIDSPTYLVSSLQLDAFRSGAELVPEQHKRGIRCAYFCAQSCSLSPGNASSWRIVIDGEQDQDEVVALRHRLRKPQQLAEDIDASVSAGSNALGRIMAAADGFQSTAEENVSAHHYANVLFNVLRGGIFDNGYTISSRDFRQTIRQFNTRVAERNSALLAKLPERLSYSELLQATDESGDAQLQRLTLEYLPITFGRRHGDPSRPWNQFAIVLKDEDGEDLLSYQGNWRDIFQNWEALALSYPTFIESMIAKFVNASTADGYNPYRITKEGIDWEVEELDNPWSYIGYWGDHQIIYLLKLLELSRSFRPDRLNDLLQRPQFCYANVPYRIKPFDLLVQDPKNTVVYDEDLASTIEERVASLGADGKLLLDTTGKVRQVNLLEKLLVPLLAKLGNLVVDGGIWLNTQRPEWNDANNALVGQGLSMVTLYYMRRYLQFLQDLLATCDDSFAVSAAVVAWHQGTAEALRGLRQDVDKNAIDDKARRESLTALGQPASNYREALYSRGDLDAPIDLGVDEIRGLLADALIITDRSIASNRRPDGLYHAYNIADFDGEKLSIENLYPMLEGQVAALSSGAVPAAEAVDVLEALYKSTIYRADQDSFMLYPDRDLPGFLERNRVPEERAMSIPLLHDMLHAGDTRIVLRDADGDVRFNADFRNAGDVRAMLDEMSAERGEAVAAARRDILDLYESVFDHKAFTGRSGTMFGYEGLGSIYWHMVSKLLLAVAENFVAALESGTDEATVQQLGDLYYRTRKGIGFNKTPLEYGAFPVDPYSHTPKHAGARQPGMTGQVKEEILTRFIELGVRVENGETSIRPALLRRREFADTARSFCYLDVDRNWQTLELPAASLAFTWCQVPFVYVLGDAAPGLQIELDDGKTESCSTRALSRELSTQIFERTGRIRKVTVTINADDLFGD